MADSIRIQVSLEGADEIRRQLAEFGDVGEKAFNQIANSAKAVGGFQNLGLDEVEGKLRNLGITGSESVSKILDAVKQAGQLGGLTKGVESATTAFTALSRVAVPAISAIVSVMTTLTKATISFADTVNKASDQAVKLGQSLEGFKSFQQDMAKLGVSGQAAADGFAKFQQNLQKAAQADPGSQLAVFGQNAEVARQQLEQTLATIRRMPDGLQRTQAAIDALDQVAGVQFVQGLRAAEGSMSASERKSYELGQALERLSTAWTNFGSLTLAPALTASIDLMTDGINRANQSTLTFAGTLAQITVNPFAFLAQQATLYALKLAGIGPAGQQAGQQAAQGLQLIRDPLTGMVQGVGKIGPAGQQAGQQAAQGFELIVDPLTGMIGVIDKNTQSAASLGSTAQQAGQQAAQGFQVWNEQLGKAVPPDPSGWVSWSNTVVDAIQNAISKLLEWIGLKDRAGGGGGGGASAGATGKARGGLIGGRGTGTSDSNLAWLSRGEYVINAAAVRHFGAGFFAALNGGRLPGFAAGGMANGGPATGGNIVQTINQTAQQTARIDANVNTVINMLNDIGGGMISLAQGIARVIQWADAISKQQGSARGGLIGGRGTGTSDSNLAWLSRGEFVIRAAAVRHFGAGFFAALNAGMLPGFALGGLVPRAAPAFAGGGMNHVTIQFPGLPPVGGLRASSAVVEELQRSAALAQVRSGGRKPSRYS